jgi:hypothetical protein
VAAPATENSSAPQTERLANVVLQGTLGDWLRAPAAEQQAIARVMADWMQPGANEASRQEWALRYSRLIETSAQSPQFASVKIMDWLPLAHAMLRGEMTKDQGPRND